MLKINRKLSQKGFTLIEIMVALAILAIVALGIFTAYTTSFQAMADSKYRTVATNIAQKKLEEIKNSVSVAFPYYSIENQEISEKTYTIVMATNSIEDNLEQVYVTVSWKDRNGNEKNVQLETLIYDLEIDYEVTPPDVGRIALSANPLELTCCVEGEISIITAELFTSPPEQRVPSGTPVSFIVSNGNVSPEFTVTDSIGKGYTDLTIDGLGPATVTAKSGLVSSDSLQVTCTPKADKITLSANPSAIIPNTSSTITATVTDTCGNIISEEVTVEFITDDDNDIYFLVGGNKVNNAIVTTLNGIATIDLYINGVNKIATVTGTITPVEGDPISDSTTVICTIYSISVTADPTSINPDGSSAITAVLIHSGGIPAVGKTISFMTDNGALSDTEATTNDQGEATVTLSSMAGGDIATITASYTILGLGTIISDTTTVQCTEYIINIVAEPNKVIPDSPSTITATLTNYLGTPASNRRVVFSTTEGVLSDTSVYTNSSGIAITTLTLYNIGDIAEVSATFGFASDFVIVKCIEFILVLTADPITIIPGGISEITATLTNYSGTPQSGQTISFGTDNGTFTETSSDTATDVTNASGEAMVHLTLNTAGTTAVVTATYAEAEATVLITCSDTYITLTVPPNIIHQCNIYWWRDYYYYYDDTVRFDLDLYGGPLVIDKVNIEWEKDSNGWPSRYRRIWIKLPGGNWTQIFNMGYPDRPNYDIETLNMNSPYVIPINTKGFQIEVNFSYTIRNKHIVFTLNPDDPNAENYQVEFYTPN
jgi:type II secretion system protein I